MMILMMAVSLLLRPVIELMPGVSGQIFDAGPAGLSLLLGAIGAGALVASLWLARRGEIAGLTGMVIFSILGCGVSLLFAIITSQLWIALTFLTFVGVFMLIGNVGAQSLIQNTVDQEVRARVLGLFIVFAHGLPAVGAVVMGWIASVAGLPMTIGIGALLMVLVWLWARPQSANMADVLERPEPG